MEKNLHNPKKSCTFVRDFKGISNFINYIFL